MKGHIHFQCLVVTPAPANPFTYYYRLPKLDGIFDIRFTARVDGSGFISYSCSAHLSKDLTSYFTVLSEEEKKVYVQCEIRNLETHEANCYQEIIDETSNWQEGIVKVISKCTGKRFPEVR